MSLDASVRRIAQRVMRKIGTEATIVRVTPGTYDVTTGTATDAEFVPAVSDKVQIAELEYDVVNVRREMAQHLPALYVLQLRR